jgi:hypothetical protein
MVTNYINIFASKELGAKFTLKEYCWIRPGSQLASPELVGCRFKLPIEP